MNGSVRQDRNSFLVDIRWQGERCRIFSDKDGVPLDFKRRADRLLSHIRYEIDHGLFDPKNYVKRQVESLQVMHREARAAEGQQVENLRSK